MSPWSRLHLQLGKLRQRMNKWAFCWAEALRISPRVFPIPFLKDLVSLCNRWSASCHFLRNQSLCATDEVLAAINVQVFIELKTRVTNSHKAVAAQLGSQGISSLMLLSRGPRWKLIEVFVARLWTVPSFNMQIDVS